MPLSPDDGPGVALLVEQICSTDSDEIRKGLDTAEEMDWLPTEVIEALQATIRDVPTDIFTAEDSRTVRLLERHGHVPEGPEED